MEKFTVPQFIDVEDKIMGPITVRQFVIMMVASMFLFLGYKLFTMTVFIVWALFWLAFVGILGFLRINGKPFHFFMLNLIETLRRPAIRSWNKQLSLSQIKKLALKKIEVKKIETPPEKPYVSKSTLSQLSLVSDTGGAYAGEQEWGSNITFDELGNVVDKPKNNKTNKQTK